VKNRSGDGLGDWDVLPGAWTLRRQIDPDEVAGFFLDGPLEKECAIRRETSEHAEADAKTR